ncbi:hypothetical protein U9M48_000080 [Paspalum notatum var. saurae]|uniref:Uncharacterized protein n=1 Tax=Paspalum notatum var. saurae TaxID=547442 RepID=A0AAQ3PEE7_PASNO
MSRSGATPRTRVPRDADSRNRTTTSRSRAGTRRRRPGATATVTTGVRQQRHRGTRRDGWPRRQAERRPPHQAADPRERHQAERVDLLHHAVNRERGLHPLLRRSALPRPEKLSEDPDERDYFDSTPGLGDELRDDHSNDGGDETDEDETDGDTSHEGRYD